ncbi:MAG: hypothetical protein KF915_20130 [Polyangiaceae bacterium]|nr:hypothetical protein [Polyangiaceae bacterium]
MSLTYLDPSRLETLNLLEASATDRYFDYCLEPYRPRRPFRGKHRAENLLWHSVLHAGVKSAFQAPLRAVQEHVGRDLTVWGVKWDGRELWWELYFYDPAKESEHATLSSIAGALAPFARVLPQVSEHVPYMMVSFDLRADTFARGEVPFVNLYLTGETAHAGRSYRVGKDSAELENTYRFMEPKRHVDDVLSLVKSSLFTSFTEPQVLSQVLIPELFACKKVCVSKKRQTDAVYFSGIDVSQLLWFMRRFSYPAPLVQFLERHQASYEHLYFDVGVDYRIGPSGGVEYPKTSYYGVL